MWFYLTNCEMFLMVRSFCRKLGSKTEVYFNFIVHLSNSLDNCDFLYSELFTQNSWKKTLKITQNMRLFLYSLPHHLWLPMSVRPSHSLRVVRSIHFTSVCGRQSPHHRRVMMTIWWLRPGSTERIASWYIPNQTYQWFSGFHLDRSATVKACNSEWYVHT